MIHLNEHDNNVALLQQYYNNKKEDCQGTFFIYDASKNLIVNQHHCREVISYWIYFPNNGYQYNNWEHIGFRFNKLNIDKVKQFFDIIEKYLGERAKVEIIPTQYKEFVIIKLPPFWAKDVFRHNVFTLFLRCACVYFKGDFERALKDYELTNKVKHIIDYFLQGYVNDVNKSIKHDKGIIKAFGYLGENEFKKYFAQE
jgi:hypothetical protein